MPLVPATTETLVPSSDSETKRKKGDPSVRETKSRSK